MPVCIQIFEHGCGYSHVVSAALVTDKSSGSVVGGLLVFRSICTLTDEPLGGGALTDEKSGPSTTCTVLPIPLTRSTFGFAKVAATVAAACSLPGENNTVVDFSELG
jgi:hypothetical protein